MEIIWVVRLEIRAVISYRTPDVTETGLMPQNVANLMFWRRITIQIQFQQASLTCTVRTSRVKAEYLREGVTKAGSPRESEKCETLLTSSS